MIIIKAKPIIIKIMLSRLINNKLLGILVLTLVLIFNLYLAHKPQFYTHLQTDIVTYYYRSSHFHEFGSYFALERNEYQPGALTLFAFLSQFLRISSDFFFFKNLVFAVNIAFSFLLLFLYKKIRGWNSIFMFSLILLFTGPIFLFRFDLYVMVFIIASYYFWLKKREGLSLLFLGWAALTKIFPIIFLPYYLILSYKKGGFLASFKTAFKYFSFTLVSLLIFMWIFKFDLQALVSSWDFLAHVPVNTESVWGNLLSLYSVVFRGRMARGLGDWGTFGIAPSDTIGPLWFYTLVSFLVVSVFYLLVFIRGKIQKFDIKIPLTVILTYIVFSRVIHHQYTLWYMLLLPLINSRSFQNNRRWRIILILTCISSLLFIYIYPLHFSEVVSGVYYSGTSMYLFFINLLRNMLLIILWLMVVTEVFKNKVKTSKYL